MKKHLFVGATLAGTLASTLAASLANAGDIDSLQNLTQTEFRALSEDLGATLSYKSLSPAKALGVTGFDLSLSVTGTSLGSLATWKKATGGDSIPSTLPVPMLRLAKGLPFNIDVGAFYLAIPDTNVRLYGGEMRWAFIEGGIATPAVSVHGTYSKLTGVDQLDLDTRSVDVSISKGFTVITPYAGVGQVWTNATPVFPASWISSLIRGAVGQVGTNATPVGVPFPSGESITQTKYFGGLNFNLGLPNIAVEADQTGGITSYGVKFGLRW